MPTLKSPHRKANTRSGDIDNHVKNNHTAPCMREEPGDGVDKNSWRGPREIQQRAGLGEHG